MKNKTLLIAMLSLSLGSQAQNYVIQSKSATESSTNKLTIDTANAMLILEPAGKPALTYPLDTLILRGEPHAILRDGSSKDEIMATLNCSEAELNTTFRPLLSGVTTMIDAAKQSPQKSIDVVVEPKKAEAPPSSGLLKYGVGGLVGLLLGIGLSRLISLGPKPKQSKLHIDEDVASAKQLQMMEDISRGMNITKNDVHSAGSFGRAVQTKYQMIQNQLTQEKNQNAEKEKEELRYFQNLEKTYTSQIQKKLQSRNFSDDREPQRVFLQNVIPMALHYDSYIKIRQKKAQEYDKLNYKNIYDGGGDLKNLSKVKFESNYVDNDPYVATIIAIMEEYGLDELPEVSLYNKRIAK